MPKLSKDLKKGLLLLGDAMPATTEAYREKVTGRQFLAENVTHLPGGAPVLKNVCYGRPARREVNHGRRLCGAYTNRGRAGVLDYCRPHIEPEHFPAFSARLSELVPAL